MCEVAELYTFLWIYILNFWCCLFKLKEYEASGMKHREVEPGSSGGDITSDERIKRIEKECQEQEELLARFQAENKRLYEEIRSKEKAVKLTEEAMFKENQRLMAELVSVKWGEFISAWVFGWGGWGRCSPIA